MFEVEALKLIESLEFSRFIMEPEEEYGFLSVSFGSRYKLCIYLFLFFRLSFNFSFEYLEFWGADGAMVFFVFPIILKFDVELELEL